MKAFFDTNVYIQAFFRKGLSREKFANLFAAYDVVVCPIVKHELLLGVIQPSTKKELEAFFDQCPVLEAPARHMWEEMTGIMKKLNWRENHQQNDLLIALTAREEDATLVTFDRHFEKIQKYVDFELVLLKETKREAS